MYVLVLASTKGGAGKTTLSAHLAVEAERSGHGPVAIIDADPQASLARWWNARKSETPTFVSTTIKDLAAQIQTLKDSGYGLVVIDTPGADVSILRPIIRSANLVLVPSRPSPLDLGTLNATVEMIQSEKRPLMFVLNAVTPRTRISAQAVMALSEHGPVAAILHQRTDFASAMTDGRVAGELDPTSKSQEEIAELWTKVITYLRKHSSEAEEASPQ
jgi:chromosome partitioning protein